MDLDQFLSARGATLPALVAKVGSSPGLCPDDHLVMVGSLVEGLATRRSDLDLLLVSSRPAGELPGDTGTALVVGRCLVDVSVWPRTAVDEVLGRFDRWRVRPWDTSYTTSFTKNERILLHRLVHGVVVIHDPETDPDALPRPEREDLARLKLQVARHRSRTVQVDMAGHRASGDARSLVFAGHELLGYAADALLAGHLATNPLPKWRSRLLERLPADWESGLASRPSGKSAQDLYWELHRAPERPEGEAALEHALRIAAFARAAFAWAERRLVQPGGPDGAPRSWPKPERRRSEEALPHLDLDVDFQLAGDGALVGRLNDFGRTIELSVRELGLILLFDGVTTAREAGLAVCGPDSGTAGTDLARELVGRVREAGLTLTAA